MKSKLLLCTGICILMLNSLFAQRQQPSDKIASIERSELDNTVTNIIFSPSANLQLENGMAVLKEYLQMTDPDNVLKEVKTTNPYTGISLKNYDQWYKGIKVEHGRFTILSAGGTIISINGVVYKPETSLSAIPAFTEGQALQKAMEYIDARTYLWQDGAAEKALKERTGNPNATYTPAGTVVWIEDLSAGKGNKVLHLAYKFDIIAKEPYSSQKVYVDAITGKILLTDNNIKHIAATGKTRYSGTVSFETSFYNGSYILRDTTRKIYTLNGNGHEIAYVQFGVMQFVATDFTNPTTSWPRLYALDAHWGITKSYDYWKNVHNRNSVDDMGEAIISYVNVDSALDNAGWIGGAEVMIYGNGTGITEGIFDTVVALDVAGHELSHAVCQYTAGLIYQQESGALNEGFSDIWGANIEHYAAPEKSNWQVGEEVCTPTLRNMKTPKNARSPQPNTYKGQYWNFAVPPCLQGHTPPGNDFCGVHDNSGVLNYWYYLLTEGGSGTNDVGTSYVVAGIGWEKSAKIAYLTELSLTSTSDFAACRTASIAAATTLFGACSAEVEAVIRAWKAVNVGSAFVACGPQIGFVKSDTTVTLNNAATSCPSSFTIDVPVGINVAPSGGNAVITVSDSGSAKAGIDYTIASKTATFAAGSDATQHILVTILNHGAIAEDKTLTLRFKVTPNGSNAVKGNIYHEFNILIKNQNKAPVGEIVDYTVGKTGNITSIASPFFSEKQSVHMQFIISAKSLLESGLKPNEPISDISFNVVDKKSTRAFMDYTIYLGQSTQSKYVNNTFIPKDSLGGHISVFTMAYQGNYTTVPGWNTFHINAPAIKPFVWDGTRNIVCEICFANGAPFTDATDRVEATAENDTVTIVGFTNSGTGACNLSASKFNFNRPVVRFRQYDAATAIEKAAVTNRSWDVHQNQNVYFYNNANGKLIANLNMPSQDLGCVTASLTKQGNGFSILGNTGVSRSVKEYSITPTTNATTTNYQATLYLDSAEIGTQNLSMVRILKTNATTDADINNKNSVLVTPTVSSYTGYKGFTGNFTGFARYFLVTDSFALSAPSGINMVSNQHAIRVDNNPFNDKIYISYSFNASANADINLFDITGKLLYSSKQYLSNNEHRFAIELNNLALTPGNYVLQIITPEDVLRQKMVKE